MPTTSNFGWTTPADTDLVKDGAAAIRTLGNGIDTSFLDLKGGTSGQILAKNSATDLDFVWVANDQGDITGVTAGTGISGGGTSGAVTITNSMATEITAKGDLIVGTGNAAFDNLPAGTNGHVLTADSTVSPTGLKWAAPAGSTPTYRGVGVYLTSSVAIGNNAWTVVGWTNEHFDSNAYHDNSTNNSRLTIPAGYAGKYLISGNTNWDAYSNASIRGVQIYKNGVGGIIPVVVLPITNGTNGTNTSFAYVIDLAVSDYIEIYVYQNTGGNANLVGGTGNSSIQLSLLGA